jgi:hypothetical protein
MAVQSVKLTRDDYLSLRIVTTFMDGKPLFGDSWNDWSVELDLWYRHVYEQRELDFAEQMIFGKNEAWLKWQEGYPDVEVHVQLLDPDRGTPIPDCFAIVYREAWLRLKLYKKSWYKVHDRHTDEDYACYKEDIIPGNGREFEESAISWEKMALMQRAEVEKKREEQKALTKQEQKPLTHGITFVDRDRRDRNSVDRVEFDEEKERGDYADEEEYKEWATSVQFPFFSPTVWRPMHSLFLFMHSGRLLDSIVHRICIEFGPTGTLDNRSHLLGCMLHTIKPDQLPAQEAVFNNGNLTLHVYPNTFVNEGVKLVKHEEIPNMKDEKTKKIIRGSQSLHLPTSRAEDIRSFGNYRGFSQYEWEWWGMTSHDLEAVLLQYATLLPTFRLVKRGVYTANYVGLRVFNDFKPRFEINGRFVSTLTPKQAKKLVEEDTVRDRHADAERHRRLNEGRGEQNGEPQVGPPMPNETPTERSNRLHRERQQRYEANKKAKAQEKKEGGKKKEETKEGEEERKESKMVMD